MLDEQHISRGVQLTRQKGIAINYFEIQDSFLSSESSGPPAA